MSVMVVVGRERRWWRFLAWVFSFPPPGDGVPVTVVKTVTPRGETWERRFGDRRFRSHMAATTRGMTERFGPFAFRLGLHVHGGALHFPVDAARFGPIPLPRWALPVSESREYVRDGRFHFDVRLLAPLTHDLLVQYAGDLSPQSRAAGDRPEPETSSVTR